MGPSRTVAAALLSGALLSVSAWVGGTPGVAQAAASVGATVVPDGGVVVSVTDITAQPDAMLRGAASVHRVTYRSLDATGQPVETMANLYVPASSRADGSVRLMAYAHGTVGLGDDCAVGLRIGTGGGYDDWLGPWLEAGYAIVLPEYAGIGDASGHAYNHGETSARNTVDAVRAAREVFPQLSDFTLAPGFVTDGGSQGAHTSVWVNHLLADGADSAEGAGDAGDATGAGEALVGSSASSLPADIGGYVGVLTPGIPAVPQLTAPLVTYVAYLLAGMENTGDGGVVDSPVFTDLARQLATEGQDLCYPQMVQRTAGIAPGDLVTRPLSGTTELARLREYAAVPDAGFSAPLLVQQGGLDVVAPLAQVEPWAQRARAAGASVDLRTYPTQGHGLNAGIETTALTWAESLDWPRSGGDS